MDPLSQREGFAELWAAAEALSLGGGGGSLDGEEEGDGAAELRAALLDDDVVTIVALCVEAMQQRAAAAAKAKEDMALLSKSEAMIEALRRRLAESTDACEALRGEAAALKDEVAQYAGENAEQAATLDDLSARLREALEGHGGVLRRLKEAHAEELRATEARCMEAVRRAHPELERERALTRDLTETIKVLQKEECRYCRRQRGGDS